MADVAVRTSSVDSASRVAMAWLVRLRWGATLGQIVAIASGAWLLGIHLRLVPALLLTALTAVSNVALHRWTQSGAQPRVSSLAAVLATDLAILAALLFVSGGAMNPFSVFFLVYVALAALVLDARATWALAAWSSLLFGSLFVVPLPEGTDPMAGHAHMMADHLRGMWIAYTLASFSVAHFVSRAARALEERERQITALREKAARAERLASLSTLAAGAAHELGTPLATIAVVAGELAHATSRTPALAELADDARMIRSEVERCRAILQQMGARAGESIGEAPSRVVVSAALADVIADLRERASLVDLRPADDLETSFTVPPRALTQVLAILVRNALDAHEEVANPAPVSLSVRRVDGGISFEIADHGPGVPADRLARIGEPFFTTKQPGKGLGLGVFLAHAFAERVGGRLSHTSVVGEGTTATLWLPLVASSAIPSRIAEAASLEPFTSSSSATSPASSTSSTSSTEAA